jgi:hypothetical protein
LAGTENSMTAKPLTLEDAIARTIGIHDTIAASQPKLARGRVWCIRCQRSQEVDSAHCLAHGCRCAAARR